VFFATEVPAANVPTTVTVAPGRVVGVATARARLPRGDGVNDDVGPFDFVPEPSIYACNETTKDRPTLSGTRKHPVIRPLNDCWMKFDVGEQSELGSTKAVGVDGFVVLVADVLPDKPHALSASAATTNVEAGRASRCERRFTEQLPFDWNIGKSAGSQRMMTGRPNL
jgi:hypothetical protein